MPDLYNYSVLDPNPTHPPDPRSLPPIFLPYGPTLQLPPSPLKVIINLVSYASQVYGMRLARSVLNYFIPLA